MQKPRLAGILLALWIMGCAPVIRLPAPEAPVAAAPATRLAPAPVGMNPGKVLLIVVGAFSAFLVLLLVTEGTDLSD